MSADVAEALAALRAFNYERIYTRPESLGQAEAVVEVLHGLVAYYQGHIDQVPTEFLETDADRIHQVVAYVGGMTDQFAFPMPPSCWDGTDAVCLEVWVGAFDKTA